MPCAFWIGTCRATHRHTVSILCLASCWAMCYLGHMSSPCHMCLVTPECACYMPHFSQVEPSVCTQCCGSRVHVSIQNINWLCLKTIVFTVQCLGVLTEAAHIVSSCTVAIYWICHTYFLHPGTFHYFTYSHFLKEVVCRFITDVEEMCSCGFEAMPFVWQYSSKWHKHKSYRTLWSTNAVSAGELTSVMLSLCLYASFEKEGSKKSEYLRKFNLSKCSCFLCWHQQKAAVTTHCFVYK